MKAITVRDLPPEVEKTLRARARKEGLSLNRVVARFLAEATGCDRGATPRRALHHDLDEFAGAWTKAEADEFDASLAEQRSIDPHGLRVLTTDSDFQKIPQILVDYVEPSS